MGKIKNWLLAAIAIVLGSIEMTNELLPELLQELGAPAWAPKAIRVLALVLTVIVMKLQPPSLKEAKEEKLE